MRRKQSLVAYLQRIITLTDSYREVKRKFTGRVQQGNLTRDDDPKTHFCVYFAAYDLKLRQVFIGHHKKSGLWLFNGGHMDKGDTPRESVIREMNEEWEMSLPVPSPSLLTLTKIEKPEAQICQWHYDIWYFILVDETTFRPKKELLGTEFLEIGWKSVTQARKLARDPSTITAFRKIVH